MLVRTETFRKAQAEAAELTEESSTLFQVDTTAIDPWDHTISIPAGSNRLLLDFVGTTVTTYAVALDPAGDNISLTQDTNSPQSVGGTNEQVILHTLLEASFPGTTGNKVLRWNPATARVGRRRVVVLSGAHQTNITSAGNNQDAATDFTLTATRGAGSFPTGSLVYAATFHEQATGTYTVTGDATEVDDEAVSSGTASLQDVWVFAKGTLAAPDTSVSVTFASTAAGAHRSVGIIVVVEPAA